MSMFSKRSFELELMDFPVENKADIFKNFDELVFINAYLGGSVHSIKKIGELIRNIESPTIADIGFGAGDFLSSAHKKWPKAHLIGVDSMPESVEYAQNRYQDMSKAASLICSDYREWIRTSDKVDIIHASLFCHHLDTTQLIEFLELASSHVRVAVVINDLHRNAIAYYSIKLLTALFSKSVYTRNDAPLSVLRGFHKSDWEQAMQRANISSYQMKWKWAFRHILTTPPR